MGRGKPPIEFLIAFEEGLREYRCCVHSLGTRPLRSPTYWRESVDVWRKKEAYIALGRFLHGEAPGECSLLTLISPRVLILSLVGYRQWDCFKFADYVSRRQLGETFVKRHLPLSNGFDFKNFGDKFKFDWKKHSWQRSRTTAKPDPDASVTSKPTKTPAAKPPAMIFDVDLGRLVPLL